MSAELQRACAEELIAELRKLEHVADRKNPGCILAVCLGQAHRMIEELLEQWQASRTPGRATEVCRRLVEWSESENDADYPLIRVIMMAKSLLAEHGHAPPAVASEPLPPEILEYLDGQT